MGTRNYILGLIATFQRCHGLSERQFGLEAVGDHRFVARLRRGLATLKRIEKAEDFMRDAAGSPGVDARSREDAA